MIIKKGLLAVILVSLLTVTSCGYRVGSLLPPDIKTIAVPIFENLTIEPELEIRVTNGIIREFVADGTLEVVEEGPADTLLIGEIIGYTRQPLRYTKQEVTREYRLLLSVKLRFEDLRNNKVMWEYPIIEGETTFFVEGSLPESEQIALPDAIEDLAHHVVEKVVEGGW